MQIWGEAFESDPEFQAGMVEFTCLQTYRGLGPDGSDAGMEACSNPERPCFKEY
jgi:hypothetical protein